MSENRKYCCSNSVVLEVLIVTSADTMLSMLSLGIISFWAYNYYAEIDYLKNMTRQYPGQYPNTETFLQAEPETRSAVLLILLFMSVLKLCSCCVLLVGSYHKNQLLLLKLWIIPGIILYIYLTALTFVMLYYIRNKLLNGLISAVYLLFQLYLLWIVKVLIKELSRTPSTSESQIQLDVPVDASFTREVQDGEHEQAHQSME